MTPATLLFEATWALFIFGVSFVGIWTVLAIIVSELLTDHPKIFTIIWLAVWIPVGLAGLGTIVYWLIRIRTIT